MTLYIWTVRQLVQHDKVKLPGLQNNWEAVKALALDTSRPQQQLPTSPSQDAQSAAQVSHSTVVVNENAALAV